MSKAKTTIQDFQQSKVTPPRSSPECTGVTAQVDYTRDELIQKIKDAAAQLEHTKKWMTSTNISTFAAEQISHAIDHALSDLDIDPGVTATQDCEHVPIVYPGNGTVERTRYCKKCLTDLPEVTQTAEQERAFWIAKFKHWIKCQEGGSTHNHIKATGFQDCVNAMERNDRWVPHGVDVTPAVDDVRNYALENAAELVQGWHVSKGGYTELAYEIRALKSSPVERGETARPVRSEGDGK